MKRVISRREIIGSTIVIVVTATIWFLVLLVGASESKIPQPLHSPSLVTESPVPKVHPSPVPKVTPVSAETKIYVVVKNVPSYWGVSGSLTDWNLVDHYADFVPVKSCPDSLPCLTVKMKKLPEDTAAETNWGEGNDITIDLNPIVASHWEAKSTICHELGHVLGLPHVSGTANTCMTAIGSYRIHPTIVDARLVNSYGVWETDKMYLLSGKDVDIRSMPR